MTRIGLPKAALPLLVYCKTNSAKRDDACFSSYAELVVFLASFGYKVTQGRITNHTADLLEAGPEPIEFTVFKNQGLFPQVLLLGLAVSKGHSIAKNEQALASVVETLATAGAVALARTWANTTPESFVFELVDQLCHSTTSTP